MVHEPKNPACCSYKTQCTSGITHIDTLKSNFEIDQLEQQWPDMYCQHQNPDGVFNIGYTRKWFSNLFFESSVSEYVRTSKLDHILRLTIATDDCDWRTRSGTIISSILWLLAMIFGVVLHFSSLLYYVFGKASFFWTKSQSEPLVLLTNGFMCGQGLTSVEKYIFPGIIKLEEKDRLEILQISKWILTV